MHIQATGCFRKYRCSLILVILLAVPLAVTGSIPITIENLAEISEVLEWPTQGVPVFDLVYSSDGLQMYGVHGNSLAVWDASSGELVDSWSAHPGFAYDHSYDDLTVFDLSCLLEP